MLQGEGKVYVVAVIEGGREKKWILAIELPFAMSPSRLAQ